MRVTTSIIVAALAASCAGGPDLVRLPPEPAGPTTVFRQVDVFPGDSTEILRDQDVWVEEGVIRHMGPSGDRALPEGATMVDGAGRTLLPGLIDLHVHVLASPAPPWKLSLPKAERNLQAFLWAGITTVVDLGGDLKESLALREKVAAGKVAGPRMLVAGPHLTAPGGHPVAMVQELLPWYVRWLVPDEKLALQPRTAEEARRATSRLLGAGVDVVKVTCDTIPLEVPVIEPEIAAAVVDTARAAGRRVFAHVGTNADARRMLAAGVDVFAHGIYREPLDEALAAELAEADVAVIPTLMVFDNLEKVIRGELETDAVHAAVRDPEVWAAIVARPPDYAVPASFRGYVKAVAASRPHWLENVRRLRAAGVTVLAGSDSPNVGTFAGAAFHRELRLLEAAGLSPAEVLQTATFLNARAIGREGEVGSIAEGMVADLLLVEGDPSADLAHLQRIDAVYLGGRRLGR